MKMWLMSRNLVALAAFTASVLLVIYALLSAGVERWLIPTPEATAESLVQALSAHRYEAIPSLLHSGARPNVREEDLAQLVKAIEEAHNGIESIESEPSTQDGNSARVTLIVRFADQTRISVTMPLAKENTLWRVTSIDALSELTSPGS